jgi:protein-S-isoprenylcysteine O-methyltransferase Ste14
MAEEKDVPGDVGAKGGGDPDWTAEERREFRSALDTLGARQRRAGQIVAATLVVLVAAGVLFRAPESWWVPAVGAVALLGLVFRLVNWKCPRCGERLPTRRSSSCLGCGAPLGS